MQIYVNYPLCWKLLSGLLLIVFLTTIAIANFLHTGRQHKKQSSILLSEEDIKILIRDAESSNSKRIQRVQKVCQDYNLGLFKNEARASPFKHPPTPQYSVFYIDLVHKLSWCPIYKAASSSLLYNLCLLGGYSEDELKTTKQQLSTIARKIYPELDYRQAEEALQSTLKLLVVRHPFERILSAYRDKLENINVRAEHGSVHFYRKYGSKIVSKYREGGNNTKTHTILKLGTYFWDKTLPQPSGIEPTFQEFVRYLIDTDLLNYSDDHWIPYYLFCTPCLLKYNILAKVETFFRDQIYIIRATNLQNLIKPIWKHKTINDNVKNISKIYFSQLTQNNVAELYQKYKLDFELFDYDATEYYKYAQSNIS
ncbi:carbohydrate sulfotransferase 11-like [Lycorma delicatula]|uniref:carbohydrate sulfotransferase 11-like n=1 Tax=Lycorma delicatula TaxID=130591 RepID=UPI003F516385